MNRTNIICLLLAVAGLSFGIGQSVGEDRAEAGAQAAKVQSVKDPAAVRELKGLRSELKLLRGDIGSLKQQLIFSKTSAGADTIRHYIFQTCKNTDPARFGSSC